MISLKEIFDEVRAMKSRYEMIDKLVDKQMLDGWERYLENKNYPTDFIIDSNKTYNLLSLLFYGGFEHNNKTGFKPYQYAIQLIDTLNQYLIEFEELALNLTFRNKIKNIDGFNFFSTMSELSISHAFKKTGNTIEFDFDYLKSNGKKKDIDIKISNQLGNFFFEIYTPNDSFEINGFFDPSEFNQKFSKKLTEKIHDKFSKIDERSLNGKRFLVANAMYSQGIMINYLTLNIDKYLSQLIKILPDDIDGLLIFTDDFSSLNSFKEIRTIIKENG